MLIPSSQTLFATSLLATSIYSISADIGTIAITITAPFDKNNFLDGNMSDVVKLVTKLTLEDGAVTRHPFKPFDECDRISAQTVECVESINRDTAHRVSMTDMEKCRSLGDKFVKDLNEKTGIEWHFGGLTVQKRE